MLHASNVVCVCFTRQEDYEGATTSHARPFNISTNAAQASTHVSARTKSVSVLSEARILVGTCTFMSFVVRHGSRKAHCKSRRHISQLALTKRSTNSMSSKGDPRHELDLTVGSVAVGSALFRSCKIMSPW